MKRLALETIPAMVGTALIYMGNDGKVVVGEAVIAWRIEHRQRADDVNGISTFVDPITSEGDTEDGNDWVGIREASGAITMGDGMWFTNLRALQQYHDSE